MCTDQQDALRMRRERRASGVRQAVSAFFRRGKGFASFRTYTLLRMTRTHPKKPPSVHTDSDATANEEEDSGTLRGIVVGAAGKEF